MYGKLLVTVALSLLCVSGVQSRRVFLRDFARSTDHGGQADRKVYASDDVDEISGGDEEEETTTSVPVAAGPTPSTETTTETSATAAPTVSSLSREVLARKIISTIKKHEDLISKLLSMFEMGKEAVESLEPRLLRIEEIVKTALTDMLRFSGNEEAGPNERNLLLSEVLKEVLEQLKLKYPNLDLSKIEELFVQKNEKRLASRKSKDGRHVM